MTTNAYKNLYICLQINSGLNYGLTHKSKTQIWKVIFNKTFIKCFFFLISNPIFNEKCIISVRKYSYGLLKWIIIIIIIIIIIKTSELLYENEVILGFNF